MPLGPYYPGVRIKGALRKSSRTHELLETRVKVSCITSVDGKLNLVLVLSFSNLKR